MLHLDLKLDDDTEKTLVRLVSNKFNGSYEKFIESVLPKKKNGLSKLIEISEDLGVEDLAHNHDNYLYGTEK